MGVIVFSRRREIARKLVKLSSIICHRRLVRALVLRRVAAATEHLAAVRFAAPNTLIDVGANKGQFSLLVRTVRPAAEIIAFEPLPRAADTFSQMFAGDEKVSVQRVALAGIDGLAEFHIADRADSSSLLKPGVGQERAYGVRRARTVDIPVARLDNCIDVQSLEHPILLKVDVQGGEVGVFEGCDWLGEVDFIYVELSFVELYVGQPLFEEVNDYLAGRGFRILGVFNQVHTDEFGPTQVDVLFGRQGSLAVTT